MRYRSVTRSLTRRVWGSGQRVSAHTTHFLQFCVCVCVFSAATRVTTAVMMAKSENHVATLQPEAFWEQCIREMYPGWQREHYFVPALHVNKTHYVSSSFASQEVSIPQAPLDAPQPGAGCVLHVSDTRNDSALQRVRHCLQELASSQGETMFVVSQLDYGDYLRQPSYAAAADSVSPTVTDADVLPPRPANLNSRDSRGDFDFLILHRKYGIVVAEVKAVGDNWGELQLSEEQQLAIVLKRVKDAIKQLDKAERVLTHLLSDQNLAPRILKTIFLPGVQASIVRKSLMRDPRELRNLGRCLAADPGADPVDLCLCSDHLSDPEIPWRVTGSVLARFQQWWYARIVSSREDPNMTDDLYLKILARFCGPATTVKVPWNPQPPLRTTQDAINFTDTCFSRLTLFPEQVNLLHGAPPRLFACGPPGTGKTVVLLLQAVEWLRQHHEVHVVSTWKYSRAASFRLRAQLLLASQAQALNEAKQKDAGITPITAVLMHEYDFEKRLDDVDKAVEELAFLAKGNNLYVIADEAGPDGCNEFKIFCEKLLDRVPGLHLWAARCRHDCTPEAWCKEYFTRPLRFAPVVKRKVVKSGKFSIGNVLLYSSSNVPNPTDGPPVIHLNHDVARHTGSNIYNCTQCGDLLATVLRNNFGIGQTDTSEPTNPPVNNNRPTQGSSQCSSGLHYHDVVLMYWASKIKDNSGMITGMRNSGIPVKVATSRDIENVATRQDDVVWAVDGYSVQGLEWKVAVYCSDYGEFDCFTFPSRCTSQLVCFRNKPSEG